MLFLLPGVLRSMQAGSWLGPKAAVIILLTMARACT